MSRLLSRWMHSWATNIKIWSQDILIAVWMCCHLKKNHEARLNTFWIKYLLCEIQDHARVTLSTSTIYVQLSHVS